MPDWHHSPVHRLEEAGAYIVTAGTYRKQHIFRQSERTAFLHDSLLETAFNCDWQLQAWAVFSNHYHFVGISENPGNLRAFLQELHSRTAVQANEWDGTPGRQVWYQYRDTRLTFEKSYHARLNYVMQNPVRHGLVKVAKEYPYCSAYWFEREAAASFVKTVLSYGIDRVSVPDDY
jgi:putative transposase